MADDILKGLASKNPLLKLLHTRYPGYHPILAICDIAHHPDTQTDFKLLLDCHKSVLNYVAPTLKALELQGEIDHNLSTLKVEFSNPADLSVPIEYEEHKTLEYDPPSKIPMSTVQRINEQILVEALEEDEPEESLEAEEPLETYLPKPTNSYR